MPEGEVATGAAPARDRVDPTLVKALARAHRWKRLLEEGHYASISELARAEKIDRGYLGRILLLTLLAPDIVEAILDGRQPPELGLPTLMKPFPVDWPSQRNALSGALDYRAPHGDTCDSPLRAGHYWTRRPKSGSARP
jgi:hypothetical protein